MELNEMLDMDTIVENDQHLRALLSARGVAAADCIAETEVGPEFADVLREEGYEVAPFWRGGVDALAAQVGGVVGSHIDNTGECRYCLLSDPTGNFIRLGIADGDRWPRYGTSFSRADFPQALKRLVAQLRDGGGIA